MTETLDRVKFYNGYLDSRTGCFEYRSQRYRAVARKLKAMGLECGDTIVDIGAGRQEFLKYLNIIGWQGIYVPLDGSIDGIDLSEWLPTVPADFFVAIEFLEHIRNPWRLMQGMVRYARKGVAATTPNPRTTDVLGMDPTHVIEIYAEQFEYHTWNTQISSFYGQPDDSVLAWRQHDGRRLHCL